MCKEDCCKHLLQLDAELAKGIPDNELTSPGTPPGAVSESLPCVASGDSAVSGDLTTASNTAVFFARVPPTVPYEELLDLFSKYGSVQDLNLFRRWATAKTSKGCGTVQYSRPEEASAAMLALNGVHTFDGYPGCEGPMVVEWMDASRLTAPCDAAHKSARARDTSKAPAKPLQHKPRNKCSTGSNAPCAPPGWQYYQQVNTMHARALAAAATAGCSMLPQCSFSGLHPGVEALDMAGLLSSPLAEGCGTFGTLGLGDPANWGSLVPVHLLPMMRQSQGGASLSAANPTSLSPLLPSAAAAMSQMSMTPVLQPSFAAAAGVAAAQMVGTPGNNTSLLSGMLSGSLGCPTPGMEPWLSGGFPSRSDSTNLSFTSAVGPTFAPSTNSFLAAAVAQQQAQQQLCPLMVLEDVWPGQVCEESAPAATNAAPGAPFSSSSSFNMFDSTAHLMGGRYHDVAPAAGQVMDHNKQDGSSMLAGSEPYPAAAAEAAPQGDTTELLSGQLGHVLTEDGDMSGFLSPWHHSMTSAEVMGPPASWTTRHEGCLSMQRSTQSTLSCAQQQPGQQGGGDRTGPRVIKLSLTGLSLGQLALSIPHVAQMSGAEVQMVVSPAGTELRLQGTPIEVEAAQNLVHLLGQGGSASA